VAERNHVWLVTSSCWTSAPKHVAHMHMVWEKPDSFSERKLAEFSILNAAG
jgi:hypothetical protein